MRFTCSRFSSRAASRVALCASFRHVEEDLPVSALIGAAFLPVYSEVLISKGEEDFRLFCCFLSASSTTGTVRIRRGTSSSMRTCSPHGRLLI